MHLKQWISSQIVSSRKKRKSRPITRSLRARCVSRAYLLNIVVAVVVLSVFFLFFNIYINIFGFCPDKINWEERNNSVLNCHVIIYCTRVPHSRPIFIYLISLLAWQAALFNTDNEMDALEKPLWFVSVRMRHDPLNYNNGSIFFSANYDKEYNITWLFMNP